MKLAVFSIKSCRRATHSPSALATDGGFLYQMPAISELFGQTTLVVPDVLAGFHEGDTALTGHNMRVAAVDFSCGIPGLRRKRAFRFWLPRTLPILLREFSPTPKA